MSKAKFILDTPTFWFIVFALFICHSCTKEQPIYLTTETTSSIVGIVKPLGVTARINVIQGIPIDSTYSDSTSGYFKIDNLRVGFYTLEVKAAGYGKYVENGIQVIANGITAVGEIQLKPIPEQILAIIPSAGTKNIKLTDCCGFEFVTLMNHNSVEENFSITPEVEGYFLWDEKNTTSTFYFYPELKYKAYTIYTFSLNTNAKTIYEDTLSFAINSDFVTESVKVEAHSPEDGASYINPNSMIYVKFNTTMDRASVESSFNLGKETTGSYVWHNSESFSFKPDDFLATNTVYVVSISIDVKDIYNTPLGEPFSFSFTTEPLLIINTYPSDGATYISSKTTITIYFNTNMNQSATEGAFSISPVVNGNIKWIDLTKFTFSPNVDLTPDTWYEVTINTNCADSYGKSLSSDYSFRFKTRNE